jgi:hypothetical protein
MMLVCLWTIFTTRDWRMIYVCLMPILVYYTNEIDILCFAGFLYKLKFILFDSTLNISALISWRSVLDYPCNFYIYIYILRINFFKDKNPIPSEVNFFWGVLINDCLLFQSYIKQFKCPTIGFTCK